jgi:hypothetical protein
VLLAVQVQNLTSSRKASRMGFFICELRVWVSLASWRGSSGFMELMWPSQPFQKLQFVDSFGLPVGPTQKTGLLAMTNGSLHQLKTKARKHES